MLSQHICTTISYLFKGSRVKLKLRYIVCLHYAIDFRKMLSNFWGLIFKSVCRHILSDFFVEVDEHKVMDHRVLQCIQTFFKTHSDPIHPLNLCLVMLSGSIFPIMDEFLDLLLQFKFLVSQLIALSSFIFKFTLRLFKFFAELKTNICYFSSSVLEFIKFVEIWKTDLLKE